MATWTISDDDGQVMTIGVPDDSLIITLDTTGTPFRTRHPEIAQDIHQKLGVAIGQMPRNDD